MLDPDRPSSPLFRAVLAGNLDRVDNLLGSSNLNQKAPYAINHASARYVSSHWGTPLEYALHLMQGDNLTNHHQQEKWLKIVRSLVDQGAYISNKAVRYALNLLIHQSCNEHLAFETLKILDEKVDWNKSPFVWGKTSCLEIVLEYLPGAVSSLQGGKNLLIKKGMTEPDANAPHLLQWPHHHSPHSPWHRWFAWHPVKVQGHSVFLKTVERCENIHGHGPESAGISYSYRPAAPINSLPQLDLPPAEKPSAHVRQHLTPFGKYY